MTGRELVDQKIRTFMDGLWEKGDPWDFESSSYERDRCRQLLKMLEGRRYARVLEADAARAAMGWSAEARWLPSGAIEVRYRDSSGQPVTGLSPQAVVTRPIGDPVRLVLSLQAVVPGVYRASVVLPYRGQWDIQVLAAEQPQAHRFTERIMVP